MAKRKTGKRRVTRFKRPAKAPARKDERASLESEFLNETSEIAPAITFPLVAIGASAGGEEQIRLRNILVRQLMDAQEQERHRLSRELHDELGQHVTALILGLQQIRRQPEASAVRSNVEQLLEIANKIGHESRRVALNLRPTALDDLGLQAALANYAEDWSRTSGVRIELQFSGNTAERLPSETETTLYRVVQEALTNVARHAHASRASIVIHWDSNEAHAIIEDDGRGFNSAATIADAQAAGRLGLLGIQERARLAGGSFELESRPGYGTTVFVRLPTEAQPTRERERERENK